MSRQTASKSRAEKSRGAPTGTQSVPVPLVTSDVIPGRLTDGDWGRLMCDEEDTGFIGSLVESIVDSTLDKCHKNYIWKQVLPFTAYKAKEDLIRIVEWQFLSRDVGENDVANDAGWTEDSEPEPGIIDSWAQGSVPVVIRPQSSSLPSVSMISEDQGFLQEPTATTVSDERTDSTDKTTENAQSPDGKAPLSPASKSPEVPTEISHESNFVKKKKKPSYKKHVGRLLPLKTDFDETLPEEEIDPLNQANKSFKQSDAHLSPSQKSLLKVQAGRPPGNREVTFDEKGNVVGVMKLNTQNLPTHKVRVQYDIIDPEAEANAQRLAALRTGKLRQAKKANLADGSTVTTKSKGMKSHPPKSVVTIGRSMTSASTTANQRRHTALSVHHLPHDAPHNNQDKLVKFPAYRKIKRTTRIEPLPPTLIDTIDASPGVVIREGGQIKAGPEEKYPVGITRSPRGSEATGSKTVLRLLGNTRMSPRLRPTVDPRDVIGDVIDNHSFAVHPVLPPVRSTQTASS